MCKATPDDFERLRAFDRLHKDSGSPYYYDLHWMAYLTCETACIYLATQDNDIKGLIHTSEAEGETVINHLFVAPPHRKQGIGRALLEEALKDSDAKNYEATLYVVETNRSAMRLYQKFGFAAGIPGFEGIVEMIRMPSIRGEYSKLIL